MRKIVAIVVSLVLGALPALGHAGPMDGVTSANVEFIRNLQIPGGATSAKVVGKRLYVVGWFSLSIFDISDPTNPVRLSQVPLGFQFPHEDVDTNGKVLVLAETNIAGSPRPTGQPPPTDVLHIWDVRDPRDPVEIATLPSNGDRSLTCLYNCTYAYGAAGTILNLEDPTDPKVIGNWGTGKPIGRGFDVTEVRPGIVTTSTRPMMVLDARDDVANPSLVATGRDTARTTHYVQWPHHGNDDFILSSVETFGKPRCDAASGPLITWNSASVRTGTVEIIDEFRLTNGTITDGRPVANKLACSAHMFDAHPDFRDGGIVALAYFDHGTRFVRVDSAGKMTEVGYFMPFSGQTFSVNWANDRIAYAVDLERGIDVLRFTPPS